MKFHNPFRKPSPKELAQRELEEAQRELLVAQSAADYARRIAEYARPGTDAFAWILDGRQVAQGPDHEPLVRECRPVARLTDSVVAEACNVWRTASGHDRCERPRPG